MQVLAEFATSAMALLLIFFPVTSMEDINRLLSTQELVLTGSEFGISDDEGKLDRFSLRGNSIVCIYKKRVRSDGVLIEIIDLTILWTFARMIAEFHDGEIYEWKFRESGISPLQVFGTANRHDMFVLGRAIGTVQHAADKSSEAAHPTP